MPLPDATFDVVLGDGAFERLADILSTHCPASRFAIIADASVANLYGERVLRAAATVAPAELLTFPAGEWNKSRDSWSELTDRLLRQRFDADGAVLTLGGGVAGDLGGFVSATYHHGMPFVHLPTTLLAMTDSALSGRTGVDSPAGRGAIGVRRVPAVVVADVASLGTLPPAHVAAGAAAAIRSAVTADRAYLGMLVERAREIRQRVPDAMLDVVRRSVELRRDLARWRQDRAGRRDAPEFGSTIRRALGSLLGYEMLYGETLAVGMRAEAAVGIEAGVTDPEVASQLRGALEAFGLPDAPTSQVEIPRLIEVLLDAADTEHGTVRFAVPRRVGEMADAAGGIPIAAETVDAVLRRLGW